jgi:hypothetical protein
MTASMKELLQQKLRVVRSKLDKYPQMQELEVSSFRCCAVRRPRGLRRAEETHRRAGEKRSLDAFSF